MGCGGGGMLLISTTQLQSSVKLCELIFEDAIAVHMVQYSITFGLDVFSNAIQSRICDAPVSHVSFVSMFCCLSSLVWT